MSDEAPKRRWYRFSLRTLLLVSSVGIIILGVYRWPIDPLPHESEIENITARGFYVIPTPGEDGREVIVPKEYWKQILAGFRSTRRMKERKLVRYQWYLAITTTDGRTIRVDVFEDEFRIDGVYYQGGNGSDIESVLRAIVSEQEQ